MQPTKIEWADVVWNPTTGCSRIAPGCQHCYAERMSFRQQQMGSKAYQNVLDENRRFNGTVNFQDWVWLDPLIKWKRKPKRIFVNSMSDLFHEAIPIDWIHKVLAVVSLCPQHTFIVLTKRGRRMREVMTSDRLKTDVAFAAASILAARPDLTPADSIVPDEIWVDDALFNLWLLHSVAQQSDLDACFGDMVHTPGVVLGLSCEPLIGPLDLSRWITRDACGCLEVACQKPDCKRPGCSVYPLGCPHCRGTGAVTPINWVIVGGESGPGARPCETQWVRSVIDQCRSAGIPCFVKQLGKHPILPAGQGATVYERGKAAQAIDREWPDGTRFGNRTGNQDYNGREVFLRDSKGGDWDEWPEFLRVREFPLAVSH